MKPNQQKAETQTYKESRSRKFSFPRNSSFTNESVSDATENPNANAYPSACNNSLLLSKKKI